VDAARGGGCVNEMRWILLQCSTKLSLVDMPLWHVHRRLQRACLSTHKTLLRWCFFYICQSWRLGVSSNVILSGVGGWRRPLISVSARNPRNNYVFLYP
jgi:hypothetical protein